MMQSLQRLRWLPLAAGLLCWPALGSAEAAPKNLILMVGDGIGQAHLTAYRHWLHAERDGPPAATVFDELLTGTSSTHPDDDTLVTDSAASATALATGHKTCNQQVALSCDGEPLPTLFQKAKLTGRDTGLVVSSPVTHATPASFYAHHVSRHAHPAIADQLVDNTVDDRLPVDVIFGAGTDYLIREDRDLVAELREAGYQYADSWEALDELNSAPALALLGEEALPPALHSPVNEPLATLTDKALTLLGEQETGFVLMIEGSQIDWCSHANDIVCAMAEMHDFARAAERARAYADRHPDTLLVITSDHETGGLSLGRDNEYAWHPQAIRRVTATAPHLAERLLETEQPWHEVWREHTGLSLDNEEKRQLSKARRTGAEPLTEAIKALINQRSLTGWTSGGHTAVDVPVMAHGPGRSQFIGTIDNAEMGRRMLQLISRDSAD